MRATTVYTLRYMVEADITKAHDHAPSGTLQHTVAQAPTPASLMKCMYDTQHLAQRSALHNQLVEICAMLSSSRGKFL